MGHRPQETQQWDLAAHVRGGAEIHPATIYSSQIHQFSPPWQVERGGDGRAHGRGFGKEEQVYGASNEEQG